MVEVVQQDAEYGHAPNPVQLQYVVYLALLFSHA
jgi:hypothetical protein